MENKANIYLILGVILLVVPVFLLLITEDEGDIRFKIIFAVTAASLILLIQAYRQRRKRK